MCAKDSKQYLGSVIGQRGNRRKPFFLAKEDQPQTDCFLPIHTLKIGEQMVLIAKTKPYPFHLSVHCRAKRVGKEIAITDDKLGGH